ncbi:MAG: patatin-like phospholipase family protein [Pseudomonadota bacterium]
MTPPTRTEYFRHCWAVFEGGGVRGAAHAGAFAAAVASGVAFTRVAGTSAGSIVAALVAARATPEFIKLAMLDMPMEKFLVASRPRESIFPGRRLGARAVRRATWGVTRKALTIALDSGLHSSYPIQEWTENRLRQLLANSRAAFDVGPVEFRHLPVPLHIVATDLVTGRAKIWSKEETPGESVAFAVRSSCTIPFFYQAVRFGSSVLVDGGVISNLPAFVFQNVSEAESRSVLSRILAFRLKEDEAQVRVIEELREFVARLGDVVVNGATSIQLSLQPGVHSVAIPTGAIKSTDFATVGQAEKQQLYDAGHQAVATYIRNERRHVRNAPRQACRGFDEKLLAFIQALSACNEEMWAVGSSSYWIYFTFPAVLNAVKRGVVLNLVVSPTTDPRETAQRRLLVRLGAQLHEVDRLPFSGFLFDPGGDAGLAIVSTAQGSVGVDYGWDEEQARLYSASDDLPVFTSLWNLVRPGSSSNAKPLQSSFPLQTCTEGDLFARLKKVPQYQAAKFSLEIIPVTADLLVLPRSIKEFKVLQTSTFVGDLLHQGVNLFHPHKVVFCDGTESIVTPPILERAGDDLVVIEGNARAYHCLHNSQPQMTAVVVSNVKASLPATPLRLGQVRLTSATVSFEQNYGALDKKLFRRIEEAVHA